MEYIQVCVNSLYNYTVYIDACICINCTCIQRARNVFLSTLKKKRCWWAFLIRLTLILSDVHPQELEATLNATRRGADNILNNVLLSGRVCVYAGYGLHCHRAVITLCKLIGIKDMYCKVEGSVNLLNITRALFTGLANQVRSCDPIQARSSVWRGLFLEQTSFTLFTLQETHQKRADKKQLHVVEFQEHRGPLPQVVASPRDGARPDAEPEDEVPNARLRWDDIRASQGLKRSIWAGVKRTIW